VAYIIAVKKDIGLNIKAIHNDFGITISFVHSCNWMVLSIISTNQAARPFLDG